MTLRLHTLPKRRGRRSKRVGRGHGSGRGTYAGRGMKGQRARTGGKSGLAKRALKQLVSHIPKQRGFRSFRPRFQTVTLAILERRFQEGERVTPERLAALGYRRRGTRGVKILGGGALTKKLTVAAHAFSESAKRGITQAGGTVITLRS